MEMIKNGNLIGSMNGTVVGGAELVTGRKGFALHMNGIGQHVDFGYQGDTCLGYFILCTSGWVAAFWCQSGNDKNGVIMDTGAFANKGTRINFADRYFCIHFCGASKKWYLHGGATTVQGWLHVVVTWQLWSGAKLYINGEMVNAVTCPSNKTVPVIQETRFVLGASYRYTNYFEGGLDELRVWDAVMSDEEVMALYTVDAGLN